MIKISDLSLKLENQVVLEDVNLYLGKETYLLTGTMYKRKSIIINELARAANVYNKNILYNYENEIAYLPNKQILMTNLTVKQNLEFFAKFFKTIASDERKIIDHFDLYNILERKVDSLTFDLKQLVRIACVFLNTNASVYLLDNVFEHLNKSQIDLVKSYLYPIKDETTIIFSKSNVIGIEEFNPRILNIVNKKLVYEVKDEQDNISNAN